MSKASGKTASPITRLPVRSPLAEDDGSKRMVNVSCGARLFGSAGPAVITNGPLRLIASTNWALCLVFCPTTSTLAAPWPKTMGLPD